MENLDTDFVLLLEKEAIWVRMLEEVLKDNGVPCVSFPVLGAAFTLRTGLPDSLRLYVPAEHLQRAMELREELFSAEFRDEDFPDPEEDSAV